MRPVRSPLIAWSCACLLSFCNGAAAGPDVPAANDWTLTSHRDGDGIDGVDVYVRPVPGSSYDEARAVGSVCAPIDALTSLVTDVSRFEEWIPDTERASLLATPSPYERIYYIRTGMPWPIKDRDMIYRVVSSANPNTADDITVTLEGLPDYAPPVDGVVRMTSVRGQWHFAHVAAGTRIALEMRIEPGGGVPAWLAKRRIVGMPARMLLNIGRMFASSCPIH
jgi:START domain